MWWGDEDRLFRTFSEAFWQLYLPVAIVIGMIAVILLLR